jgi:hypothetical protein
MRFAITASCDFATQRFLGTMSPMRIPMPSVTANSKASGIWIYQIKKETVVDSMFCKMKNVERINKASMTKPRMDMIKPSLLDFHLLSLF